MNSHTPTFSLFALVVALVLSACGKSTTTREVVVYTSVDQVFSEPVLRKFEQQTGIRVRAVYDVEAAKTTGLAARLAAEKDRPKADLFWNNEFLQTLRLRDQGILGILDSTPPAGLPDRFVANDKSWIGLGGRARVFLVNTTKLPPESYPKSVADLADPKIPAERAGMALPLFGTTATHAAALYASMGPGEALGLFQKIQAVGVKILPGNSSVRDQVVSGQLWYGLTDTDDALGALERKAPVAVVAPDQDGTGAFVVFGTVAAIKGAPHPSEAKALADYLLSPATEQELIRSGCFQWSLREGAPASPMFPKGLRTLDIPAENVLKAAPLAAEELRNLFVR